MLDPAPAIHRIAQFAVSARPVAEVRPLATRAVADCMGCILAGAHSEVATGVARALGPFSPGAVPLYGAGKAVSAPLAAQINAVAGHAWDLDDWEEPGNTHPTVVLLPAMFAAAHMRPVSGRAALDAYAVGCEIIMRLGAGVTLGHYARGIHSTASLGVIGAAGAVARLLGLSLAQTAHALALSVSQAMGYTLQFGSGAKPLQAGWAARNGVEAALLAQQGLTAQPQVLDHPRGFAGLLGAADAVHMASALDRLGAPWALQEHGLVLKPWPSCGYTHRLMTAAMDLRPRLAGRVQDITRIEAYLPDFHAAILPFDDPKTRTEALFSVPACVGQILINGRLTLADSAAGFWTVRELARLIHLTQVEAEPARRPALNYDPDQPDRLRITLRSGERIEATCAYPLGAMQRPMQDHQLADKFAGITGRDASLFKALLDWPESDDIAMFFERVCNDTA